MRTSRMRCARRGSSQVRRLAWGREARGVRFLYLQLASVSLELPYILHVRLWGRRA